MDEIGLKTSAMHAIRTLAGLADSGNEQSKAALASACEKGFTHASSPVRNAAVTNCTDVQLKSALDIGLLQDADPRVQLAAMLRVADAAGVATGDVLAAQTTGDHSIGSDDILLDAWTSAASTKPIETLVALINGKPDVGNRELVARVAVLAEHIGRTNPTAEKIESLLSVNPQSPMTIALWEGLAKGWPKDQTVTLSDVTVSKFHERFLGDDTSVESKAAVLAVADKWSIQNLEKAISDIQSQLMTIVLDAAAKSEVRLKAWDQAIRLAPTSSRILDVTSEFFTPQLDPEIGAKAIDSLRAARVEGFAQHLLSLRRKLGPKMAGSILTLLLTRSETTQESLHAIADGKVQFSELQLDQRQAILNYPIREISARAKELMEMKGAAVASNRQALVDGCRLLKRKAMSKTA